MKTHPLAKLFPEITGQDFIDLVADIKANGLLQPIITLDDQILDGVNRSNACLQAKVKPRYEKFTGKDPKAFVISQNLSRRHLTAGQRAMIATEIAQSKNSDSTPTEAAKTMSVSRGTYHVAARVKKASPKLAAKVKSGKMSLHKAEQKINPRPLARGGLAAEAIRAKQAAAEKPAALKGIDMGKVDPVDSPRITAGITPEDFQKELELLEKLIPAEADHKPYFNAASKLAERLAQFKV
jgi:ParB-like chromosome segregation protein Spo0J